MSESTSSTCPRCRAELPPDAPGGLCPRCLAAMTFATETVLTNADAAAAQPSLTPEELSPHFPQLDIIECLGRGGMGVVYKARQKSLNRMVALKLLAPERATDREFAERFATEAHALARLNHPNIVTVHDFGQAGGFFYLLMEFVDGVNLRQLLRTRNLQPAEALAIVPPVCEALQYAHEHGIVHRDIKPENLLLDKSGRAKIADFGIARIVGNPSGSDGAGKPVTGTPPYMAPEQRTVGPAADHRADIYSLGVVLYELLTGELPADKLQPPSSHIRTMQIDVRLDEVVLRALEKNPEMRFQTAAEFGTQVGTVAATINSPPSPNKMKGGKEPAQAGPDHPGISAIPRWIMNTNFEALYRQLGRTTVAVLFLGLAFQGLIISLDLLELPHAVTSFKGAASLVTYVFIVLLALFLIASLIAAFLPWHEKRFISSHFEYFYRQLGRTTAAVLLIALALLGLALLFALLGLPHTVASFRNAAFSVACVFLVLLALFLMTSLVAALLRWLERRNHAAVRSS